MVAMTEALRAKTLREKNRGERGGADPEGMQNCAKGQTYNPLGYSTQLLCMKNRRFQNGAFGA